MKKKVLKLDKHLLLQYCLPETAQPYSLEHPLIKPYTGNRIVRFLEYLRFQYMLNSCHFEEDEIAFDAGSGSNVFLPTLAGYFKMVYAVDSNEEYIRKGKELCDILHLQNVQLFCQDLSTLSFPDNTFNVIFCASVLEHLRDKELVSVVRELKRVLRTDGVFCCSSPTETLLYQIGRRVFGFEKPKDHYQTSKSIFLVVREQFPRFEIKKIPFNVPRFLAAHEMIVGYKPVSK